MTHQPTVEQQAIVDFARSRSENLMVDALPGTGKTSVLVMLGAAITPVMTLSLAFNKRIAVEMKDRFPSHIETSTLNSLGHRAWGRALGTRLVLDTKKTYGLVKAAIDALGKREKEEAFANFAPLMKAVDKARLLGWVPDGKYSHATPLTSDDELWELLGEDSVEDFPESQQSLLRDIVCQSIAMSYKGVVDFNDQVYMPTIFGAPFTRYPLVLVDEAQDFSGLNHRMLSKVVGGRIIAVGDPRQSIYAFRGAHVSSMEVLREQFKMQVLPLTVCFRCPQRVIELARFRAPTMSWPPSAPLGVVEHHETWEPTSIPEGSAIICRNNAPLFSTALYLLRSGRSVKLVGSDIGPQLIKLLKKIGKDSTDRESLIAAISTWRIESLAKAKESKTGLIQDRADCLMVFAQAGRDLGEAVALAEHIFSSSGTINLLTGHKSKGLEWDIVYHLDPWRIPSKFAKRASESGNDAPLEQELNLRFIITTRAKRELHFIESKERNTDDK